MFKSIVSASLAALLIGVFFISAVRAGDESAVEVATATPSNANTPVSSKNIPLYLDEDLASKHADFSSFAKAKVNALNRNHVNSKSRMQIVKQADGSFLARYHDIDSDSLICKVRRSESKSVPYVAVLRYKEKIMEAVGASPDECRNGQFIPVAIIPNRHIFSYMKGGWQ